MIGLYITSFDKLKLHARLFDNKESKKIAILLHGYKDHVIPYTISKKLADAYPHKIRYEVFKNADHGASALTDYNRYQKVVKEFLDN